MKRFKSIAFWVSLHALLFGIYGVSRSNVRKVDVADCENGAVAAIAKLSDLVEQNFMDREYYEVVGWSGKRSCIIVNYNTDQQVLLISTDPGSDWLYCLEATPQQLKAIATNHLTLTKIAQHLTNVPENKRRNYPNG